MLQFSLLPSGQQERQLRQGPRSCWLEAHTQVMNWKYNLSAKWTALLLQVGRGEYFGQIQLLLALSERLQTDTEESTTQLIHPLALPPL